VNLHVLAPPILRPFCIYYMCVWDFKKPLPDNYIERPWQHTLFLHPDFRIDMKLQIYELAPWNCHLSIGEGGGCVRKSQVLQVPKIGRVSKLYVTYCQG